MTPKQDDSETAEHHSGREAFKRLNENGGELNMVPVLRMLTA